MTKTATVLLDTLSLYHAVRRCFGGKIDYGVLLDDIRNAYDVEWIIAYVLNTRDNAAFVKMLDAKGVDAIELCTEQDYAVRLAVDALVSESQLVVLATASPLFDPLFAALGHHEAIAYTLRDSMPRRVESVLLNETFLI